MTRCIEACKQKACAPDIHEKKGCNQMYSCSHGCKMRQLGVDEQTCKNNCQRNGASGCFPKVSGHTFELCGACMRKGCATWPTPSECEIGCTEYGNC